MKANELRIGNYLYFGDAKATIKPVYFKIEAGYSIDRVLEGLDVRPILLSEEILLNCGFKIDEEGWFHIDLNDSSFGIRLEKKKWIFYWFDDTPLQYLHQLQNLYFALTGEELDIKL